MTISHPHSTKKLTSKVNNWLVNRRVKIGVGVDTINFTLIKVFEI